MRRALTALAGAGLVGILAVLVAAQGGGADGTRGRGVGAQHPPGHIIRHKPIQTPFGIEVLSGGWARDKYPARGRVYVEAVEGDEYELRLSNPLPVRVAVALSVDGLNTIDARRTSARDASKWVIPPYGSITVSGWQMSSSRARRFYFTNERDSYANKLGRPSDLGVITAVFFRERRTRADILLPPRPHESQPRNHDRSESKRSTRGEAPAATSAEQSSAAGRARPSPQADEEYAATGIGRSVTNDVWSVQMDLESSPAAEMTLRYEFRDALVRLGVLPRNYPPQPDPLRRRERARGFEDRQFSPEP
ncbi:MAG TPA: hypothetical protein VEZ40_19535 [Pyrinomonadaceae bacterium]|nr:hypothetical protein [Pyrinomonadaceae bacterium]